MVWEQNRAEDTFGFGVVFSDATMDNLEAAHAGIKEKLVDEAGDIRRFVNVYVNDEDIRFLDGAETPVKDGDSVTIVPAIAGG